MYSPLSHDKHPRVRWGDTSYDHQVYVTTTEPMSYPPNHEPRRHPIVDFGFHKSSDENRVRVVPRAQMMESEYYGYPQLVKTIENFQVKEDVNQEAEDFIALEHKKFMRSRTWMPTKSG
ncbi:hypothetical protein HRI_001173800 [Hibiscus trionum]|uniref:Uncharacterized protein n=1 Tax=Hibiscus trionum TaxID=183268 RepID=A0A9W7HCG3_HIBTR|nr:hypothetical protein HRI_001173800 [Hibiscus trionum]